MACLLVDTRPSDRGMEWVSHVACAATSALKSELDTDKAAATDALALCAIHMSAEELCTLFWCFARTDIFSHIIQMCQGTASDSAMVSIKHAIPDSPRTHSVDM